MAKLLLLRHGQSIWNQQNRFTGWVDVSLSRTGIAEAENAASLLQEERLDVVFTSTLLRAQDTAYEILKQNRYAAQWVRIHEENNQDWYEHFLSQQMDDNAIKVYVSAALNERYYGDLQGMHKDEAARRFGAEQVHKWRRSYDTPPPNGESLEMTAARVMPYYRGRIVPLLRRGATILVCAHGNSLRALIMHIEQMTPEQIIAYELKTGTPLLYQFDAQMRLVNVRSLEARGNIAAKKTANMEEDR